MTRTLYNTKINSHLIMLGSVKASIFENVSKKKASYFGRLYCLSDAYSGTNSIKNLLTNELLSAVDGILFKFFNLNLNTSVET